MISGRVVEVRTETRGSQTAEAALAGATNIVVEDPTGFDEEGGQALIADVVYTWTTVAEVPDATNPATVNASLTLASPLVADVAVDTPVQVWLGTQVYDRTVLSVDFGDGRPPVDVYVRADKRAQWSSLEGAVDPPIEIRLTDDLSDILDVPGYSPSYDGNAVWNPYVSRRVDTPFSVAASGFTVVTAWTDTQSQGVRVEADGSVTILFPGFYVIDASPSFATNSTGSRTAEILVNGVRRGYLSIPADTVGTTEVPVGVRRPLAEGDNVVLQLAQSSGAALALSNVNESPASLYRVSL